MTFFSGIVTGTFLLFTGSNLKLLLNTARFTSYNLSSIVRFCELKAFKTKFEPTTVFLGGLLTTWFYIMP